MDTTAPVSHFAAVDAAVALACESGSWDAVRMHDVACAAGMSLEQLLDEYPDRDALVEACFDRADTAMLAQAEDAAWPRADVRDRLQRAIIAWLGALPPRRIVRGMIGYKLQPEHMHLQARAILRTSRTVQTLREVAMLRATGLRREVEEAALTTIWLATFASWLFDESTGEARTFTRMRMTIDAAHRVGGWSGS